MVVEKLPPQNIEAEQAVIGSLLIGKAQPDLLWPVLAALGPTGQMFYNEAHGLLYEHIVALARAQGSVDFLTLCDSLDGQLEKVGGQGYVVSLINAVPTCVHAAHYASIVAEAFMLREVIRAAKEIADLPYRDHESVDDVIANMRRIVNQVQYREETHIMDLGASLTGYLDLLQQRTEAMQRDDYRTVTLPWSAIQNRVRRVEPGTLVAIVGAPGMGKTAFMEQWAEHLARAGLNVIFFHLELSNEDMRDRMVQRHTGIPFADLREPLKRDGTHDRVVEALGRISEWSGNIRLVGAAGWTTARIVSAVQDARAQGLCDVAFVDYMNLIRFADTDANSIDLELNDLKNVGTKLGIPIVIAQQPDKASRKERVMLLESGKMTGGLHERCNLGITLTRKRLSSAQSFGELGEFEAGAFSPETVVRIDKATFGPSGEVKLMFWGERLSFGDVDYQPEPGEEPLYWRE